MYKVVSYQESQTTAPGGKALWLCILSCKIDRDVAGNVATNDKGRDTQNGNDSSGIDTVIIEGAEQRI